VTLSAGWVVYGWYSDNLQEDLGVYSFYGSIGKLHPWYRYFGKYPEFSIAWDQRY